jgi:hypothetical protein
MSQPKQLAPVALAQLAAWRRYAAKWNYHLELRQTDEHHRSGANKDQYHLVCAMCHRSISLMMHDGIGYLMNTELTLDNVTRHLREFHRGLEATIYGTESTAVDNGARSDSANNRSDSNSG